MKKERLMGAIVLGSIGLIANPVWSHGVKQNEKAASEDNHQMMSPRAGDQMGLSSQDLSAAQRSLNGQGFQPGNLDGVMDEQTQQAIAEFQQEKNLPITGTLDVATADQLGVTTHSPSSDESQLPEAEAAPQDRPEGDQGSSSGAESEAL